MLYILRLVHRHDLIGEPRRRPSPIVLMQCTERLGAFPAELIALDEVYIKRTRLQQHILAVRPDGIPPANDLTILRTTYSDWFILGQSPVFLATSV